MKTGILIIVITLSGLFQACAQTPQNDSKAIKNQSNNSEEKIVKTDAEWKAQLSPEQFRITRKQGTEPAFSGKYWDHKKEGTYHCVCCGNPLFPSTTKYKSGTGWPSFWAPVAPANVEKHTDNSYGMQRTEVVCSKCNAHLGHVFSDGPDPTGLRYCINSASLEFEEK